jgi:excisionase family DNA binding protein
MERTEPLITTAELAERLGVHPTTVNRMRKAGRIKAYQINRQFRYNVDEVKEALKS